MEEAQKELNTKEDPQILDQDGGLITYIFPCRSCGKRTQILGWDGMKNRERTEKLAEKGKVLHLYDYMNRDE
jgi:hypothetical protein